MLGLGLLVSGCGTSRFEAAAALAQPASMMERRIAADPFLLTVFERLGQTGGAADVYIEGDGLAWVGRTTKSLDPTPPDSLALKLAALDGAANVIYLARPCQYTKMLDPAKPCPDTYWTGRRFAPEVIDAMNGALDTLKARSGINGFNLIGYSGGAAVAVLLAARRDDVLSLRTIAGNLDHETVSRDHGVSLLSGSLNPRDAAAGISRLPQHHFIGAQDKIITPDVYDSFRRAMGNSVCTRMSVAPGASHDQGWAGLWPELLRRPVDCQAQP